MNRELPYWYNEYMNHLHEWNTTFTTETEPMKIEFISKNNKYTVKDQMNIMRQLQEKLIKYNPDYSINLLNKPGSGFQLRNKKYFISSSGIDTDLQIRSNIYGAHQPYFLENTMNNNIELLPYKNYYNNSGIKIYEFVAYKNVPKKLMLYLYVILESMNMLIYRTENYPHLNDVVWDSKQIWDNLYLHNPKK